MKILVISQYYYPEPFKINEICENLKNRGHQVMVITSNPNYPEGEIYRGYSNTEKIERINGVLVKRVKTHARKKDKLNLFLNYISFWHSSKKAVKKLNDNYDCIYVWQTSPIFPISAAHVYQKKHNCRILCYCMDLWPESLTIGGFKKGGIVYRILKIVSKRLYNYCDSIFVSSPSFLSYFKDFLHYEGRLSFIYQHFIPKFDISGNMPNNDKKIFVYAGNIGNAQSLENVIIAFKSKKECEFHIFGNGRNYKSCNDVINNYEIKNVFLHGRVEPVCLKKWYEKCDFFVLSLASDSFVGKTIPAKMLEYIYYSKPILGAIGGDAKLLLENLNCGLTCDINDSNDIAKKISEIIIKENYYLKKCDNNKFFALNNFSIDSYVNKMLKELYFLIK